MRKLRRWMAALLVAVMVLAPVIPMNVSAANSTYPTVDMFKNCTIKGLQGATSSTLYGGIDHTVVTLCLDDMIKSPDSLWATRGWMAPYTFEGEQYYFENDIHGKLGQVVRANEQGMSVSVVFLVRKTVDNVGHSDSSFLIDQGSLADGHLYYAPNADLNTYGGRAIRAYWHFLMTRLSEEGCHIDNFILGNEVNMPNQWHYSGSPDGSGDADNCVRKYADAFYHMYSAVRKYTDVSRCSISLDHSWQNDNEGKGIAAKDFLHRFNDRLAQYQSNVEWCVSTHLYPAQLYAPDIWNDPHNLAPNDSSARIIDGSNLSVMTNYIKDTFGSEHRIMLTEQGFSDECGEQVQAASLAYSYYAAKYDPMVDSFAINLENAGTADGKSLNFDITGKLAEQVYTKIDNGNEADQQWIASVCLPVIGVGSWAEIIPNYGQEPSPDPEPVPDVSPEVRAQVEAFVERMYTVALGRPSETEGITYWTDLLLSHQIDGAKIAEGFIMSNEFVNKTYDNEQYLSVLYRTFFNREPEAEGVAFWREKLRQRASREVVLAGFVNSAEFDELCTNYGIIRGTLVADVEVIPEGIYQFVQRTYFYSLGREGEEGGIEYWVHNIVNKKCTPEVVAKSFFLSSEYVGKATSDEEYVKALYKTFMDRDAEGSGLEYWINQLATGESRESVLEGFAYSEEFKGIMASYGL